MKTIISILLLALAVSDNWAFVVGGADGWGNYSIQSNPCRQYEDLIRAGFPKDHIILMGYDSVKTSPKNPYPGMIFTMPAETTERDHAKYGCFDNIDYKNNDVMRETFFGVITGDVERIKKVTTIENPRVIKGSAKSNVFIYFIDHGSDNLIVVGKDRVKEAEFIEMFKEAYAKKNYGKMVFYMEACHSGSMWVNLPTDMNIIAMSSSDAHHNAYMSNCPPNDKVGGKSHGTCISGLWDNFYMEDIELNPLTTIGDNIDRVTEAVKKLNPQGVSHWGDMTMRSLLLKDFVYTFPKSSFKSTEQKSIVSLPDVPRHLAKWEAIRADKWNTRAALADYQTILMREAKEEVEAMRLGVAIMGEEGADLAMRFGTEVYESSCVTDLIEQMMDNCGLALPVSDKINAVLRNICLPGLRAPEVDWSSVCM